MLTRAVNRGADLAESEDFIPWALKRIRRMSEAGRRRLIADRSRLWPLAMSIAYRSERNLAPQRVDAARLSGTVRRELNDALRILRALGGGKQK